MNGTSESRWRRNTSSVATSLAATRSRKRPAWTELSPAWESTRGGLVTRDGPLRTGSSRGAGRDRRQAEPRPEPWQKRCEECGLRLACQGSRSEALHGVEAFHLVEAAGPETVDLAGGEI